MADEVALRGRPLAVDLLNGAKLAQGRGALEPLGRLRELVLCKVRALPAGLAPLHAPGDAKGPSDGEAAQNCALACLERLQSCATAGRANYHAHAEAETCSDYSSGSQ